ncbi:hypothetical protein J6500_17250 [Bradyrhizobium sp. WSM 1704]|uniref:hypothetical protein n=1 Tax=Bradyrhizobium semiaridum TaxID=2821404 RepID=UPI001CE37004|nr:hypothetical protein [Bradyrhizobium semiaridum]MCA6123629.1 hypothetical protein [Bradyrhizobium semiaridum]
MSQCIVEPVRTSRAFPFVWNIGLVPLCVVVGIVVYFAAALWLQRSWQDPRPKGQVVVPLLRPFEPLSKAAFRANLPPEYGELASLADRPNVARDTRSPIVVYEGTTALGPSHSSFTEVSAGGGSFAHWPDVGVVFSASDSTDPNWNGRRYWAVVAGPQ